MIFIELDTLTKLPDQNDIESKVLQHETVLTVQQAISCLPDVQKETIILRFYHDRKLREIAEITGVSLSTAKSRLKQGLYKLKRYLDKEDFKL